MTVNVKLLLSHDYKRKKLAKQIVMTSFFSTIY